ncbi:MAG: hypothetical protein EPN93_08345 [Spirochaetes bacterium]|nr:MAG: hypothetical protein EPN93_08345 [Spirochaetota bacterium]
MFIRALSRAYDTIQAFWEKNRTVKVLGALLVTTYLFSLMLITLNMCGFLPEYLSENIPMGHFHAVTMTFTLLLVIEVIQLILGIARSVSSSMGMQLEILSLIMLRKSFVEFSGLHEPLQWSEVSQAVFPVLSGAGGALFIFAGLILYYRCIRHQPITGNSADQEHFIESKKILSLLLLVVFFTIIALYWYGMAARGESFDIFSVFYTVLIFSDILIVLLASRFSYTYPIVFRNTGFALATVLIRIALTAPHYYNAALGAGVIIFVLAIMAGYNRLTLHHAE